MPDSRINSWESWFIFNLRKINTNQYYKLDTLDAGNGSMIHEYRYMILQDDYAYNYYTYLNSGLLEAPREYLLHGLVPGLN